MKKYLPHVVVVGAVVVVATGLFFSQLNIDSNKPLAEVGEEVVDEVLPFKPPSVAERMVVGLDVVNPVKKVIYRQCQINNFTEDNFRMSLSRYSSAFVAEQHGVGEITETDNSGKKKVYTPLFDNVDLLLKVARGSSAPSGSGGWERLDPRLLATLIEVVSGGVSRPGVVDGYPLGIMTQALPEVDFYMQLDVMAAALQQTAGLGGGDLTEVGLNETWQKLYDENMPSGTAQRFVEIYKTIFSYDPSQCN